MNKFKTFVVAAMASIGESIKIDSTYKEPRSRFTYSKNGSSSTKGKRHKSHKIRSNRRNKIKRIKG